MTEWKPIETCPENTWVLVAYPWMDSSEDIAVDRFRWITVIEEEIESEQRNAKGRRRVIQEREEKVREWTHGASPDWWMPKPEVPR